MIDNTSKTNDNANCKPKISLTKTLFIGLILSSLDDGVNPEGLKEFYRKNMKDSLWVEQLIDAWIKSHESDDSELAAVAIDMISGHNNTLNTDYETKYAKLQQEFTILEDAKYIAGTQREYIVNSFKKYRMRKECEVLRKSYRNDKTLRTTGTTAQGINVSICTDYIGCRVAYDLVVDNHTEVKVVISIDTSNIASVKDITIANVLNKAISCINQYYLTASTPDITHYLDTNIISIDFIIDCIRRDKTEPSQTVIDTFLSEIPVLFCKFLDAVSECESFKLIK